jgi:hydroxylamine oxidation protein HaoB
MKKLLLAGVVAIGAGMWLTQSYHTDVGEPVPDPYAYETRDVVASDSTVALSRFADGSTTRTFDLSVPRIDRPLVKVEVLQLASGRNLIVGWKSQVGAPVLRSDINPKEEIALVEALNKYLPQDTTVFAMPSLSDRLNELSVGTYPFATLASFQIPTAPTGSEQAVHRLESQWLDEGVVTEQPEEFQSFIEALITEDQYGAARLQALADGQEAYVILHVRDSFDIGVMKPEEIHVGLRDFPGSGHAHDMTRQVKTWIADKDYAAYAVQQINGGETIRTYFLAEGTDKATLLGQLLPFNTSRIGLVDGTSLVFQAGGYWIYRVNPVGELN